MRVRVGITTLLSVVMLATSIQALAQKSAAPLTIAIFADRQLPAAEWSALTAAVDTERSAAMPALAHTPLQVLRGDTIKPGIVVDHSISVFLHGHCELVPRVSSTASAHVTGALGWTASRDGQLEPFAHVDCDRIALLLAPRTIGMSRGQRSRAMAIAVAHVILHEWSHIATQSAHHSEHGLTKSAFSAQDLLGTSPQPVEPAGDLGQAR